jgi:hypothetical protein
MPRAVHRGARMMWLTPFLALVGNFVASFVDRPIGPISQSDFFVSAAPACARIILQTIPDKITPA